MTVAAHVAESILYHIFSDKFISHCQFINKDPENSILSHYEGIISFTQLIGLRKSKREREISKVSIKSRGCDGYNFHEIEYGQYFQ